MARRISIAQKKIRGTYELNKDRNASDFFGERVRLVETIPPPSGIDPAVAAEWDVHMQLLVLNGATSLADMKAFLSLCECAVLAAQAFKAARESGPVALTAEGSDKSNPTWVVWQNVSNTYRRWLREFGLTPAARNTAETLPPPRSASRLRVVA